ncbi:MAG: hypothetical protein PHV36_11545 [Elusimicrobiales bacterium]|nr:hypothetical protein [Elusimicrobiales bacterium]
MSFGSLRRCRKTVLLILATALAGSLAYAGVLLSVHYFVSIPVMINGTTDTVSANYKIHTGILGRAMTGPAQSAHYIITGGSVDPAAPPSPPSGSCDPYVYPNPFEPNTPGRFHAGKLTFKHLPAAATIKIFAITGKLMTELHKTDSSVDYYEWDAANADGQKLASGVYIFFLTSPGVCKAKGKFSVIR